MNRVRKVKRNGTTLANYSYLADGTKVSVLDSLGNGLLYLGSMVFNKTSDGTQLESIAWDGGRIVAEPDGWGGTNLVPYLYSTDHLGSIRAVRNALTGAAVSRSDYDPYGAHTTLSGTPQRYRYNGKEDQSFAGTPYLDYGARQYGPAIGRWMVPDPLAEKYYSVSPYSFCTDNPMNAIDPNGLDTLYRVVRGNLIMIGENNENTGNKYLVRGSVKRAVEKADKHGLKYSGSLNNKNKVYQIPDEATLDAIQISLIKSFSTNVEEGGHVDSDGIRFWDSGVPPRVESNGDVEELRQSIYAFVVNGRQRIPTGDQLVHYWHIHAKNEIAGKITGISQPSQADYILQQKLNKNGYAGSGILIGATDGIFTVYNGKTTLFRVNFTQLRNVWK